MKKNNEKQGNKKGLKKTIIISTKPKKEIFVQLILEVFEGKGPGGSLSSFMYVLNLTFLVP